MELREIITSLNTLSKYNMAGDIIVDFSMRSEFCIETLMKYIEEIGSETEKGYAACDLFILYMRSYDLREDAPYSLIVDCLVKSILKNRDNPKILMKQIGRAHV